MSRARDLADLGGSADAGGLTGRNLIINGNMACSQRGTQTDQTSGYTACDRWNFIESGSTVITTSQSTDTPASQGFANSLKVDVTTASGTPSASHYAIIRQKLEGQDLQHLLYGTSSAKKITLSFWVKSPKTGKQYVELYHTDAAYHNQQSYTIAAANTWQYVSLTYNGYETTAFDNDNGNSLMIQYWLMTGSDYTSGTTTENTWHNTNANRFSGLVNVVDNTANNWFLTGVQLEVGETATPFEHRSYGDELRRCQRFFQSFETGRVNTSLVSIATSTSQAVINMPLQAEPRVLASHDGSLASGTFTKTGTVAINAFPSSGDNVTSIPFWVCNSTEITVALNTSTTLVQYNGYVTRIGGSNGETVFTLDVEL